MTEFRQEVVAYARSIIAKAKWRHRGRKPWAVDCIGIMVLSLEHAGRPVHGDRQDYGREPWKDGLQASLYQEFGKPISLEEAQPGDIALFKWPGKEPSHIGLLGNSIHGGFSLIHAHVLHGVREHDLAGPWERLLVEVYRICPQ